MITAVAVAFAAVSQAASIVWGGAISQPDGMTELAANTPVYLVWAASSIVGASTFDGTDLKNGTGDVVASTVDTHTITADEAAGWDFAETYDKTGADVNGFYAVLISDMNSTPSYSIYALDEISGTTATSPSKNVQLTWESGNYLTQGGYTIAGGSPIPEPTSGLLMLLGVAGLALRRRRA